MKVVDENENIKDIETIIRTGIIEELIEQAHAEFKLLTIMKEWQPWEYFTNPDYQLEMEKNYISLRRTNLHGREEEPVEDTREVQKLFDEYMDELKTRK